jgi:phosphate-selective porin
LKQQLRLMEQKLDKLQKQTAANTAAAATANAKADGRASVANANAAYPVKGPVAPSDVVVKMPNNRPTICTADDRNCIAITSRLHFDGGGYDYHPNTPATVPQRLDNGVNVRRARIGVLGKFMEDWNYALIYDFGGASDGFASTASVNGAAVQFLPGGALSGIENAYLSYTGIKPFAGKLAIEGGIMDLPFTLDEASSAQVYNAELAATYGPLFFQSEYLWFNVDRTAFAPLPSLKFQGGYAEVAYALTGETRPYNAASASYGGIAPANPFSLTGGWGAWEIAGRYSTIDLNDRLGAATGVAGERQTIYTLALNWYVNRNVRFMFDYLHGNVGRQVGPTNFGDAAAKFDAFAMRTQVAF